MGRLLNKNNAAKLLAFFLAMLLWIYVTGDALRPNGQEVTRTFSGVPLSWHNLDERLELLEIPAVIDLVLRGRADVIEAMSPEDLDVFVDLKGLGDGRHRLTPSAVMPRGVRVVSYRPQQVMVSLEEVIVQQKQVSMEIAGEPARGLVTGEPRLLPEAVFVRGPRSTLARVFKIRVTVDVAGADSDYFQMAIAQPVDEAGEIVRGVTITPAFVEVLVPVAKPRQEVPIRTPLQGEPAEGFLVQQVNVTPGTAKLQGEKADLQEIAEVLTPPVNIAGATASITVELNLIIPEKAEVLSPGTVTVEVLIVPQ